MVFMKSKYVSSYYLIPFLLVLGGVASFARELAIAYTLGDSSEADVFRIVYTLPNYFIQTVGTVFVSVFVGLITVSKTHAYKVDLFRKSTVLVISLFLFFNYHFSFPTGILLSGLQ